MTKLIYFTIELILFRFFYGGAKFCRLDATFSGGCKLLSGGCAPPLDPAMHSSPSGKPVGVLCGASTLTLWLDSSGTGLGQVHPSGLSGVLDSAGSMYMMRTT